MPLPVKFTVLVPAVNVPPLPRLPLVTFNVPAPVNVIFPLTSVKEIEPALTVPVEALRLAVLPDVIEPKDIAPTIVNVFVPTATVEVKLVVVVPLNVKLKADLFADKVTNEPAVITTSSVEVGTIPGRPNASAFKETPGFAVRSKLTSLAIDATVPMTAPLSPLTRTLPTANSVKNLVPVPVTVVLLLLVLIVPVFFMYHVLVVPQAPPVAVLVIVAACTSTTVNKNKSPKVAFLRTGEVPTSKIFFIQ